MPQYIGLVGTEPAQNVWDADYKLVMHMNDAPGDPTTVLDSTSNENHGTKGGNPTEVDGLIGKAQSFDGTGDVISVTNHASLNTDYATWEIVTKFNAGFGESYPRIFDHHAATRYYLYVDANGELISPIIDTVAGDVIPSVAFSAATYVGNPAYIAISYDGSNGITYIDGDSKRTVNIGVESTIKSATQNLLIGNNSSGTRTVDGLISETRISSTARDGAHVGGTNLTLRDLLIRYEQQGSQRFKMVIPAGTVSGDLTDFPVYINIGAAAGLTGVDLRALLNRDWWRGLCVRANDGSYCYIENVSWNPVTGYAELHCKLPEILTASDNYYWLMIERTGLMGGHL